MGGAHCVSHAPNPKNTISQPSFDIYEKFKNYILCPFPPLIAGDEKWLEYPAMNASFVQDPPLPLFF